MPRDLGLLMHPGDTIGNLVEPRVMGRALGLSELVIVLSMIIWGWLLGPGEARGIALVFLAAGAIMLVTVLVALASAPYRRLSAAYADAPPQQLEAQPPD